MIPLICWIVCGLLLIGGLYWMLLRPERWEWLETLQNRVKRWKYRNVRRTMLGLLALVVLDAVCWQVLPGWIFWLVLLGSFAAILALRLLYFRCPSCGKTVDYGERCPSCGAELPWASGKG